MALGVFADVGASVAVAAQWLALGIGLGVGIGLGTVPASPLGEDEPLDLEPASEVNPRLNALYNALVVVLGVLAGGLVFLLTRVPGGRIETAVAFAVPNPAVGFWLAIVAGLLGGFASGWIAERLLLALMVVLYVRARMLLDRFALATLVAFSVGFALGFLLGLDRGVAGGFASGAEVGLIAAFVALALVMRKALRRPKA